MRSLATWTSPRTGAGRPFGNFITKLSRGKDPGGQQPQITGSRRPLLIVNNSFFNHLQHGVTLSPPFFCLLKKIEQTNRSLEKESYTV